MKNDETAAKQISERKIVSVGQSMTVVDLNLAQCLRTCHTGGTGNVRNGKKVADRHRGQIENCDVARHLVQFFP